MKLKKILSLTMALVMVLALAIPALADDTDASRTINGTGANQLGRIEVTLGTDSGITLNPYQMKASITPQGATTATESYHQIFFVPVKCVNKSTWGLKVNAQITGVIEGNNATFVTSVPKDNAENREVFLYAEFGVTTKDEEPTWETAYNKSNASQVLVSTDQSAVKTVATLGAASSAKPNYLWYKFDGAAAKSPNPGWQSGDKVKANIALTFLPTVDTVYSVTVTDTTSKTAAGKTKVNFDIAPAGETIKVTSTVDTDINSGNAAPTVTVKTASGVAVTYDTENNQFTMPAENVNVTVKWTATS